MKNVNLKFILVIIRHHLKNYWIEKKWTHYKKFIGQNENIKSILLVYGYKHKKLEMHDFIAVQKFNKRLRIFGLQNYNILN